MTETTTRPAVAWTYVVTSVAAFMVLTADARIERSDAGILCKVITVGPHGPA